MAFIKLQKNKKRNTRVRRHAKIRTRLSGTAERPRLAIFKSNRAIYAQIIDDAKGATLAAVSSLGKKEPMMKKAAHVGGEIAKAASAKKISAVVFDRGGFRYAGHVKALAEAARKGGLKF